MFEIKTIMSTDLVTVREDTHIYDAMSVLVDNAISGLPVVDENFILKGVITEKDTISLLLDSDIKEKNTVADYMTKEIICFKPDDSATDVADVFIDKAIRRVPVVENNKLVGIVARRDIIKLILKIRGKLR